MRTLFTVLSIATVAVLMSFSGSLKSPGGAPAGHTGSPGDGANCTACHGGSATAVTEIISSNIPEADYAPGETYTINVNTSGAGNKGFQVSPQNQSGDLLGTLTAGSGNQLVGNNKYVTHNGAVSSQTANWSFSWTAPEAGTGNVVFYGAFVIGYSNIRTSSMEVVEDESLGIEDLVLQSFSVYPDRADSRINITYQLLLPETVRFQLFDLSGRILLERDFGYQSAGNYAEMLYLDRNMQNNIYLAVLEIGGQTYARKVFL
jgi:hypothetical protein